MENEKALDGDQGDNKSTSANIYSTDDFTSQLRSIFRSAIVYAPKDLDIVDKAKIEFLLDGLIPVRQFNMITGKPGEGKSTFVAALVAAIARGEDFIGRKTRNTNIIVVDDENPESTLKEFKDRLGITSGVHFIKMPPGADEPLEECRECKFNCKTSQYETAATLFGFDVVFIFDSRAQFEKEEENTSKTKHLNDVFRKLRDKGATIILIHHGGKAEGNTSLGHTYIKGGVDTHLHIEAPKRGRRYYTLHRGKNRYFAPEESFFLEVDHETLSYVDATQTVKDGAFSKIATAIESCDHPNQQNVVSTVKQNYQKWGDNSIRRSLKEGISSGYWNEETTGRNNESLYKLTQDGRNLLNLGFCHKTIRPENNSFTSKNIETSGGHKTTPPVLWPGQCESCFLTTGQRALCEVSKPCPKAR